MTGRTRAHAVCLGSADFLLLSLFGLWSYLDITHSTLNVPGVRLTSARIKRVDTHWLETHKRVDTHWLEAHKEPNTLHCRLELDTREELLTRAALVQGSELLVTPAVFVFVCVLGGGGG